MENFCESCGMPITEEVKKQRGGRYCQYCSDESGSLYPKELIRKGVAEWLSSWAPKADQADFEKRAEHYLKAMPAWAE